MKLATLRSDSRDGELIVVRRDNAAFTRASDIAPTLQSALDRWDDVESKLSSLQARLNSGSVRSEPLDTKNLAAPLPRAYEWIDGSAYINHVILVRRARGAEPPDTLETDPLVYQGGSGVLLGPRDDIALPHVDWGLDFESEVCVILGDTPRGTQASQAGHHIRLLMLANDITLRSLVPAELTKGFGFFCSKPATAFSPFAVTPDELGDAWKDGRVHLELVSIFNKKCVGHPNAGPEMHFSFFDLIQHITRTRSFTAGTILGSGTVSNKDGQHGISCFAEQRAMETIEHGKPLTSFMKPGDTIAIEMVDARGQNIFGTIEQTVVNG